MNQKNVIIVLLALILLFLVFGYFVRPYSHFGMVGWMNGRGFDEERFEEMEEEMEDRMGFEGEVKDSLDDEDSDRSSAMGMQLDLSGRSLTSVPGEVFSGHMVVELNLSNNNLSGSLPAEVRHLSYLKVLDLSDNNFTGVPAEVGQLSQLERLDLSNNPITGLPYELANLKELKVLDLRGTNYATADLEIIKQGLSSDVQILTD